MLFRSINQNKITVYIPREWASLNVFSIYYKTKITNYEQSEFVNNSKAWYKENGKEAVNGEAFNYTVKNINASTGATGTVKAELKIFKKIEGTDIGIKGVQFQLKNDTGTVIKDGQSEFILETNEEGTANIKGLPIGKYKVKEISAPDWVDFDPVTAQNVTFEVKEDDIEGTLLNVDNKVKTINIPVEKKWIGAVAGPVTVQVKEENSDDVIAEYELKESEGWKHTFTGLKKYTNDGTLIKYRVEEKDVPQGYTVDYETDPTGKWIIKNVQNKIEVKVIKNWKKAMMN